MGARGGESCRRCDGYNNSNFVFFLRFLCGRNELVSVLAMYSDAPERFVVSIVYRPIIRKNSSSYSKAGLFHDQSWSMTRF